MSRTNSAEITRQLLDGITSGHYPVGTLLPTEFELCDQFAASRYTIRAVLQELQDLGLVSRRKNVGTRVEAASPRTVFRPTLASVEDLVQFSEEHRRVVQSVETVTVTGDAAKDIGCAEQTRRLRISSVRMSDATSTTPIGWTDIYIDPAYTDIAEAVRQPPAVLVSSLLETRHQKHIAEIEQEVRASTLTDPRVANALQLEPGASVLKIVRRYIDDNGETLEVSVTVHPADSFAVSMRLKRSTG
ncbi:GntR family transcriptional regulator [Cupriavidus pauculus]|uniref:GntR family transcriptional regulator n=1 Tax=Cupriavidus pauculus TaxID=82633 RepID=UPI001EE15FAB|nr:GntR family transcriptional regulator [Cupriavidus pauculus]GJG94722.1 GntR family transcriptional regulator [Cupriavidus pauculus]